MRDLSEGPSPASMEAMKRLLAANGASVEMASPTDYRVAAAQALENQINTDPEKRAKEQREALEKRRREALRAAPSVQPASASKPKPSSMPPGLTRG